MGRGNFNRVIVLCFASKNDSFLIWNILRLVAFDNNDPSEFENIYEKRYQNLLENLRGSDPFIMITPRLLCIDKTCIHSHTRAHTPAHAYVDTHAAHRFIFLIIVVMNGYSKQIIIGGGEGVMLRKPRSLYENGRSHSVLKFKVCGNVKICS